MIANIDHSIKSLASSISGKCSCNITMSDSIISLFPDEQKRKSIIEIINNTYNLTLDESILEENNTLQKLSNFVSNKLVS